MVILARLTKACLFSLLWLSSAFAHADSVVGLIHAHGFE
jgi:hypothetical protein